MCTARLLSAQSPRLLACLPACSADPAVPWLAAAALDGGLDARGSEAQAQPPWHRGRGKLSAAACSAAECSTRVQQVAKGGGAPATSRASAAGAFCPCLQVSADGRFIRSLHDPAGTTCHTITSVVQVGQTIRMTDNVHAEESSQPGSCLGTPPPGHPCKLRPPTNRRWAPLCLWAAWGPATCAASNSPAERQQRQELQREGRRRHEQCRCFGTVGSHLRLHWSGLLTAWGALTNQRCCWSKNTAAERQGAE